MEQEQARVSPASNEEPVHESPRPVLFEPVKPSTSSQGLEDLWFRSEPWSSIIRALIDFQFKWSLHRAIKNPTPIDITSIQRFADNNEKSLIELQKSSPTGIKDSIGELSMKLALIRTMIDNDSIVEVGNEVYSMITPVLEACGKQVAKAWIQKQKPTTLSGTWKFDQIKLERISMELDGTVVDSVGIHYFRVGIDPTGDVQASTSHCT